MTASRGWQAAGSQHPRLAAPPAAPGRAHPALAAARAASGTALAAPGTTQAEPDERRVRHLLSQLGARPFGHQEPDLMSDTTRPPRPRDWLDDILDGNAAPAGTEPDQADEPEEARPPKTRRKRRSSRRDETETSPETPDEEPSDDEEGEEGEGDEEPSEQLPAWDPLAVAGRITRAYQARPLTTRARAAARTAVTSRARYGRLIYTASGVWIAWHAGFTPWLIEATDDAPIGIPVVVVLIGYGLDRRLGSGPAVVAWIARALYTATVITLVLHP